MMNLIQRQAKRYEAAGTTPGHRQRFYPAPHTKRPTVLVVALETLQQVELASGERVFFHVRRHPSAALEIDADSGDTIAVREHCDRCAVDVGDGDERYPRHKACPCA